MGLRHPLTLHGYDRDFALSRHIHECHSYQSWHTWMRDVTLVISHGKRAATLHCIHTRIRVTCLIEEIRKACHTNTCMYLFCAVSVARIRVTYLTYSCASLLRGLFCTYSCDMPYCVHIFICVTRLIHRPLQKSCDTARRIDMCDVLIINMCDV